LDTVIDEVEEAFTDIIKEVMPEKSIMDVQIVINIIVLVTNDIVVYLFTIILKQVLGIWVVIELPEPIFISS